VNCVQNIKLVYDSRKEEQTDYIVEELKYHIDQLKKSIAEVNHHAALIERFSSEYSNLTGEMYA
jgi:hypothetical protein